MWYRYNKELTTINTIGECSCTSEVGYTLTRNSQNHQQKVQGDFKELSIRLLSLDCIANTIDESSVVSWCECTWAYVAALPPLCQLWTSLVRIVCASFVHAPLSRNRSVTEGTADTAAPPLILKIYQKTYINRLCIIFARFCIQFRRLTTKVSAQTCINDWH